MTDDRTPHIPDPAAFPAPPQPTYPPAPHPQATPQGQPTHPQPAYPHVEPTANEGEDVAWIADPAEHLGHDQAPPVPPIEGPLPVCDYTGEGDEPCEEPATQRRWSGAAVVLAAGVGALVGGLVVAAAFVWIVSTLSLGRATSSSGAQTVANRKVAISPGTVDRAVAVAANATPSVVNVAIRQAGFNPFTGQQFTQDAGNGSGVIIRDDGYILTNYHVVQGADEIYVTYGRQDIPAKVVGTDPATDLAVLKIEGTGYPAIDVGSSKDLRVGQFVVAIGSPFGLDKTVTSGIVSALQRSEQAQDQGNNSITTYSNLIQTDAAINPGNSGGALVDETGKLIGINTLIQSPTGGVGAAQSAGIGFAIPVDFAIDIAKQLIDTGKATHPYLGVSLQSLDAQTAAQLGVSSETGALVRFVDPASPADKAGLKRGDVIVKVADREIVATEDVFAALREHKVGEPVAVDLLRGNTAKTITIELGADTVR